MSCETFPIAMDREDNPAIQLFGKRLFGDQSPIELLIELLLISTSPKRVGDNGISFNTSLPPMETLVNWSGANELQYSPKTLLNIKLFSFMGSSRLDSRHKTHRQHYKELIQRLRNCIRVTEAGSEDDVLRTLENLFLGFQGAGVGRTWCAQSFMPISKGLLAGETIWNETAARRDPPDDWEMLLDKQQVYFTMNKHRFLARGGEVLYLQLCNALRQTPQTIQQWAKESNVNLNQKEQDPSWLHEELQRELGNLLNHCPSTVTDIAEFIDTGVEPDTARYTDTDTTTGEARYVTAGNCSAESWREGYLFAVDIIRLCQADLDIVERLQLLETACAMQVLRSLAMQSERHISLENEVSSSGFRLAVSAPNENNHALKRLSRHTAKMMEKLIYQAIRCDDITWTTDDSIERDKILKEADRRYGGKLFISVAKRIGLLVPRRGTGVRFTLNERLLRLLVVTIVPIGGRLTYDRFKEIVEARYGLVFDLDGFARASKWVDGIHWIFGDHNIDVWLQEMLDASGLLIHLSDACALVENPAGKKGAIS
jgi:hypothetical protein